MQVPRQGCCQICPAKEKSFTKFAFLCVIAIVAILQAPANAAGVSQAQERDCGNRADAQLQKLYTISHDARAYAWVARIGKRLLPFSDTPDVGCTFRILNDPSIDAFSVPGYIYITDGLLNLISADPNRDEELAAIIAHELGHIGGHHITKEMERQPNPVVGVVAGLMKKKVVTTGDLGGDVYLLGHESGDEIDADRRAVDTMLRAGVDPNGLVFLYSKLLTTQKPDSDGALYLVTHPDVAARIDRVRQRISDDRTHGTPLATAG